MRIPECRMNAGFCSRGGKETRATIFSRAVLVTALLMFSGLLGRSVQAEVKIVEADSTCLMGDSDSRIDARRIATREAKRKALELAGACVESLTGVSSCQLMRDEVTAYTAGILEAEIVSEQTGGTAEHPEITIRARCRIDTDVLSARIGQYSANEEIKEQLDASVKENEDLRKKRDSLVRQLAGEQDKAQAAATRQKLDAVLSKEESNDDTHRVWTAIGARLIETEPGAPAITREDLDRASVLLQRAIAANPQNQRARYLLAAVYQQQGEPGAAEKELRTAIRNSPSSPAPHMRLAILLRERGRYPEALKEFHFVERLRPHYLLTVYFKGITCKDMNQCGKAVQYLNKFLKDKRVNKHPQKKENALRVIEECGGDRPGRQRRTRQT